MGTHMQSEVNCDNAESCTETLATCNIESNQKSFEDPHLHLPVGRFGKTGELLLLWICASPVRYAIYILYYMYRISKSRR